MRCPEKTVSGWNNALAQWHCWGSRFFPIFMFCHLIFVFMVAQWLLQFQPSHVDIMTLIHGRDRRTFSHILKSEESFFRSQRQTSLQASMAIIMFFYHVQTITGKENETVINGRLDRTCPHWRPQIIGRGWIKLRLWKKKEERWVCAGWRAIYGVSYRLLALKARESLS